MRNDGAKGGGVPGHDPPLTLDKGPKTYILLKFKKILNVALISKVESELILPSKSFKYVLVVIKTLEIFV